MVLILLRLCQYWQRYFMGWLWTFFFLFWHIYFLVYLCLYFFYELCQSFFVWEYFHFIKVYKSKMGYSFLLKNRSLMTSRTCKNISPLNTFLNFQGILKPLLITAAHPPSHGPQSPSHHCQQSGVSFLNPSVYLHWHTLHIFPYLFS